MESDAFITHHLADLGLIKSSKLRRSGSRKNSSRNFFADANIEEYNEDEDEQEEDEAFIIHNLSGLGLTRQSSSPQSRGEENSFWNFYTDANITLYASHTYNDKEKKEKEDDDEVENEFFVPHGYLRDDEEEMDEDEAFNKKKMLLLDIKEGLKDPWLNL